MAEIAGAEHAQSVRLCVEYAPAQPFDCGRPERAAPELLEAVTAKLDRMRIDRYAAVHRAVQAL
ncbi:hypothetical protein WM16_30425 [Burkholderia ubonensis]|uniref:Uncharacterized protein n=1 Tax=Burkholderia ubonensis TaxID=101571 RepID=A0A108D350_9BURK|nr:hypothetical protein [Burkholderia ubonensis]KWK85701.1 hypothetical protein WM16_30425 [Burkholderia ubonensis]